MKVDFSFLQTAPAIVIAFGIFVLLLLSYWLGHRLRNKQIRKNPELFAADMGTINGTLLAMLGLLLAFSFSMANSRYDTRRQLVIEEANAIGTVVLRTDVYPDSMRELLRRNLKDYVEERIAFYEAKMKMNLVVAHFLKADSIGKVVWSIAASYAKVDNITTRTSELIPALNEMIDITTTRRAAGEATIPDSILYFLFTLSICCSFLIGYDHKAAINWVVVVGFAIMLSATVFTIIDLDRPRGGLINMDGPNQKIVELRQMFD